MKLRVLFYVQHLLGVGHVKRAAAIARAIAEHMEVHVALGGAPVAIADFGAATVHQLPSARAEDLSFGVLLDDRGRAVDDAWRVRRKAALLGLAAEVAPRVLLVEHYPFGRGKFGFELMPLFEQMRSRPGTRILCSVRDVLVEKSDPAKSARVVGLVRQWFDAVLVHGDPDVIPFAATFPSASAIEDLLQYTGYVVDTTAAVGIASAARVNGDIVVSTGGGAVGENLLSVAIDAAKRGALDARHWRLLAGHNLAEPAFQSLQARAVGHNHLTVERARPDFRDLLSRASLSISQAGYNTVMDVLGTGCTALVIPFAAAGESEQLFRARELERRGLLTVLEEKDLAVDTLISASKRAIGSQAAAHAINLDGANGTAAAVARWAEAT